MRAVDHHVFLGQPKTKAPKETTAHGYNNSFAVFKPMSGSNHPPAIAGYRARDVGDDGSGDDAGPLALDRVRGELSDDPAFLQQSDCLGCQSELAFDLASQ